MLNNVDIGAILNEEGNIVQAVLLKCGNVARSSLSDTISATDDSVSPKNIIEQISVDTCPKRRMVDEILGGNGITFIGQYEDEGIVVVASKQQHQQQQQRSDGSASSTDPIINPHRLKPPLHNETICGDILLLKVRQGEEEEDESSPFFQDYTKDDYEAFTNKSSAEPKGEIQEEKAPSEEEEEEQTSASSDADDYSYASSSSAQEGEDEEEQGEEENDESEECDEDDDEDCIEDISESAMFNLVMGSVLRQYQESNGRGPNTEELLCIRQTLAEKMGIVLDSTTATTTNLTNASDTSNEKNSDGTEGIKLPSFSSKSSGNLSCCSPAKKRVKFTAEE